MRNFFEVGIQQVRDWNNHFSIYAVSAGDLRLGDYLIVETESRSWGYMTPCVVWHGDNFRVATEQLRCLLYRDWFDGVHHVYEIWQVCDDAECWQAWEHDVAQTRAGFVVDNVRTVEVVPCCDRDECYAYGLVRADWHETDNGVSGETSCIVYQDGLVIVNPGWNDVQPETLDDALWSHEISRAGWEPLGYVDWHDCSCNRDGVYVWESKILDWLRDYASEFQNGDDSLRASRLRRADAITC